MRRFKIKNAIWQEINLTDKATFFQSPGGLGIEYERDFLPAGSGWIETDEELQQPVISGEIAFFGYEKYAEFIRFCEYTPLVFCYNPAGTWFYTDCKLDKIKKTELRTKRLFCPVDFVRIGAWYKNITVQQTESSDNTGKIYPYEYDYIYAETSAGSVAVNNPGYMNAPCRIHIMGAVTTPSWALIRNGVSIATGKVNATIEAGKKLVVDRSPTALEIAEYTVNGEFVKSLYADSDFSTERFIDLPPGESTVTFAHSGGGAIVAFIEVIHIAKSV